MKKGSFWSEYGIGIILFAVFILFVTMVIVVSNHYENKWSSECEAKGGVYLSREQKCVKGIEEVE